MIISSSIIHSSIKIQNFFVNSLFKTIENKGKKYSLLFPARSGSYEIIRQNFGDVKNFQIEIRRMSRRGWYDWDIGNGKFFSLSKDYFFNFRIKNTSNSPKLNLDCKEFSPCTIIVRQRSE